jgi:putative transposase
MPSRTKLKIAAIAARSAALPKIPNELIDQFVTGPMTGEAVNAASLAFKKALIERGQLWTETNRSVQLGQN